ncbi:lipoprotein insertase outer membrane protein LolB [Chromobacterium sp. IIBBL 290-4]|uniref:lipoprotein insertase outer membrane protein LolB n=1 Tax=Chromobacterium sp. IIBBL 290-4 TaxID=2953890 RepID=UPI0020B7E4C1|nr:lipoprotein insertase outer membrane protein LolB [Chromobacterium sp. IIBBL 290-4]UTH76535.1 lipoprotein insertase outer membrane protein LolB [Chromobacterium sp. IIBBL 290-4]
MSRFLALIFAAVLLVGCASEAPFRAPVSSASAVDTPFNVSGRLSATLDGKGHVANFDWRHAPAHDEVAINSPLGNTVAKVLRDPGGVALLADGKRWEADDVEGLTQQVLGWPLPLSNLAWWIRGLPAPGMDSRMDADGTLEQQGWRIRFIRDADEQSAHPKRVEMQREGLIVKVVVQSWQ